MENIDWCKKQKKGISLTEPNDILAKEYIETAEETLEILRTIKGKSRIWTATTNYYCKYFSIYALLMKIGIRSEIHDCTIEVCKILEKQKILPAGCANTLEDDKNLRIKNQYYLKNIDVKIDYDKLLEFILTVKDVTNKITHEEITRIRKLI